MHEFFAYKLKKKNNNKDHPNMFKSCKIILCKIKGMKIKQIILCLKKPEEHGAYFSNPDLYQK